MKEGRLQRSSARMQAEAEKNGQAQELMEEYGRKLQYLLDKASPHVMYRWIGFAVSMWLYIIRVWYISSFYIVTYGLGIYLLNQLIGFISPQFDPEESDVDLDLPTSDKEEFRPFARRLPEFKCWYSCVKAVWTAFFMTFFGIFDVPVFWPILLLYFIMLFCITMQRQIKHMMKHKYVPFSFGKAKYQGGGKPPVKDSK